MSVFSIWCMWTKGGRGGGGRNLCCPNCNLIGLSIGRVEAGFPTSLAIWPQQGTRVLQKCIADIAC